MPESDRKEVLKSHNSRIKSYVLFRNCTERAVDVIWIGYQGEPVWYGTLNPTNIKMVNTFATHPWMFRDPDTGERMHVHGKDIYMPQPYHQGQVTRFLVPIQFPMRSLLSNSLWAIAGLLQHDCHAHQLELPRSLVQDILALRQCSAAAKEFKRTHQSTDDGDDG